MAASRYVLALLVVAALAAEFGLASISHPVALAAGRAGPVASRAAVSSVVRACPAPGSAGATAAGVALVSAGSGTGRAGVSPLSAAGAVSAPSPLRTVTQPGRLALVSVPAAPPPARPVAAATGSVPAIPARGGVMIQASGSMARGLEVEQTSAAGLGTEQCQGPGSDFWFVGPGQSSVPDIELYLMNTDSQAADATVQVLTDSGPLLGSADAGIGVPPHGVVVQSLAQLIHGSRAVSLNVTTSVGRVVAAVLETSGGSKPGGWLPAAAPPARTQVLPGLPGTAGDRDLYVAVPGVANAQIKVTAVTAKGSYQPTGGTGIDLPGGSAVAVPLPSLGGVPAAVEISSSVPVTASVSAPGGAAGAPAVFSAAVNPVQQQGMAAGNPASPGQSTELVLSAPQAPGQVRVAELTAAGQAGAPDTARVAAGHTVVMTLTAPRVGGRSAPFAVLVTPLAGSGPVYAGRVVTRNGVAASIVPLTSALAWVALPAAANSVTTALP